MRTVATEPTTAVHRLTAPVAVPTAITAEWNETANRLRIADAATDQTLHVFDNGDVYALERGRRGEVIVTNPPANMPGLVEALQAAKIIDGVDVRYNRLTGEKILIAKVVEARHHD